ncbi:MAG: type II-A CRISPR-associated protein Csn2 [Methanomassiliicoccaceae archaeon]|nr:type II-A CRISPR-associated protein Csn2 [Methanomassiliicoccaceae archaeon]
MKLSHSTLEYPISFEDGIINVLVVENPRQMSKYISDIKSQIDGFEGEFVLSEADRPVTMSEKVDLLLDPFSLNPNSREAINSVYGALSNRSKDEAHYIETNAMLAGIESHIVHLLDEQDDLLKVTDEINISNILKSLGVKFIISGESLLESICDYLAVVTKYSKIKLFIFVNIKSYLNSEDLSLLYDHISYQKQKVLFIEGCDSHSLKGERIIIVDEDLCEIHKRG